MAPTSRFSFAGSGRSLALSVVLGMTAIVACSTEPNAASDAGVDSTGDGGVIAASGCKPDIATIQKTVFLSRCTSCHDGADPAGSLDLESAGVEARLIGAQAMECGGKTLVVPGDADRSYLVEKLAVATPTCGTQMPNFGALDDDDVACVRAWVNGLPPDATDGGGTDSGGPLCEADLTACPSGCTDTKSDPKNCGTCGATCPIVCAAGACSATCPSGTENCTGACVDLTTSSSNCGSCGNKCTGGKLCAGGTCACGASVSLANQLQPILTASCASNGCHVGQMPKAKLLLTAGKSYGALVNVPSSACSARTRVLPGNADQSYLMNKLTGVGMCAGSQMPKAGGLPAAQLDLFRAWICNGAPNN